MTHPVVDKIATKHGVTTSNVLISLQANKPGVTGTSTPLLSKLYPDAKQEEIPVLTKSVTPERIIANAKLVDLSEEEIAELHEIEKVTPFRVCSPTWTGWGSLGFPGIPLQVA